MERILKLIVLGRKNAYFFRTQAGAAISDVILSLAATAQRVGINVFQYFVDIQKYESLVKADPESWLPWKYQETLASINSKKVA